MARVWKGVVRLTVREADLTAVRRRKGVILLAIVLGRF
jgi:hypothetical protein